MDIEANDLMLFARIVEAGSFSQAAQRVDLPKSTVSRRIAQLEARLGERLLQRTTRKLVLTEFGQGLLEHAQRVTEEVEAAGALAQHRQQEPSGRLRVSAPADLANMGLNKVITTFLARYPQISLDLDLSPRRVDLVAEGFDIAIRMGELPDDATLAARRVIQQQWALYAAPSYLERHGVPRHPDDLLEHDALCILRRSGAHEVWKLTKGKIVWERAPRARLNANSPDLLCRLAVEGNGIAASTDLYASGYEADGRLVRVLADWEMPVTTGWAVFPGRRLMPAKTRAFLDLMQSHCCSDGLSVQMS
ncbi:LysR family transcriptional regulator [Massilia sp. TS11]|uniref:LysR family transcriptional regulator n=1 Tax=Massilia sp. TS11 TaxID=2908003 RepID=UPI001ED9F05C|nr:LysR family transcriptional regulator [Massilia sp. TS11]MCG2584500.1 LysR family transcriptional regulator [Massilia sp. TS11]